MTIKIIDKAKHSLKFGIVGSGAAGSRLAEAWFSLGYQAVCINTAIQDLEYIHLPNDNKYHLDHFLGGSAKDLDIGAASMNAHREKVYELLHDKLSGSQVIIYCTSLGGGSGAGGSEVLIDLISTLSVPIVVISILPGASEDSQSKKNAIETLAKLSALTQNKIISNLIVVDNAKVELLYADVSQLDFYKLSNDSIIESLDAFNRYSTLPSSTKSLDSSEFAKILLGESLSTFGSFTVDDYEEPTSIGDAVISNLNDNLLSSGFDLTQTRYAGILLIANQKVSEKVTQNSLTYLVDQLQLKCGTPESIFRGVYINNDIKDDLVKVYSFFSGLGLPESRIESLKKEVAEQDAILKEKDIKRNAKLTLDIGVDHSVSAADKARQNLSKKKSAFGNLMNSAKKK